MNKHIIAFVLFSMALSSIVLTYKNNKLREELLYRHTPDVVNTVMTEEEVKQYSEPIMFKHDWQPVYCEFNTILEVERINDREVKLRCTGDVVNDDYKPEGGR